MNIFNARPNKSLMGLTVACAAFTSSSFKREGSVIQSSLPKREARYQNF